MKKWRPTFLVELESDSHGFVRVPLELYEAHTRYILHLQEDTYNWIQVTIYPHRVSTPTLFSLREGMQAEII